MIISGGLQMLALVLSCRHGENRHRRLAMYLSDIEVDVDEVAAVDGAADAFSND